MELNLFKLGQVSDNLSFAPLVDQPIDYTSEIPLSPVETVLSLSPSTTLSNQNISGDNSISLFVYDFETGQPIKFKSVISDAVTKEVLSTFESDGINPEFKINLGGFPVSSFNFKISAPGKKTISGPLASLSDDTIYLVKENFPYLQLIAVAALFAYAAKKKKSVGALDEKDLKLIALGLGGVISFSLLTKLLQSLGLWKSADTKALDVAASDPNSFWHPAFYLKLLSQGVKWSTGITATTADQWLRELDDAFSFFGDNEAKVKGILLRCQTQATMSFLAWEYNRNTGGDFLAYLRGQEKWYPWGGLSDYDINEVNKYISQLPKY